MGIVGAPLYGTDLGSAIETAKKVIAKIETNKFGVDELKQLDDALTDIKAAIADAR